MARQYLKTDCPLYDTKYCKRLNMLGCDTCTVSKRGDSLQTLKDDLDFMETILPEDGLYDLYTGDECVLCKGENKGKRTCYALTDLGNPKPERMKRSSIGLKMQTRAGSLIPLQLSCCDDCRRRFRLIEYIVPSLVALFAVIAVLLVSIRQVSFALKAVWQGLPLALFVGLILVGWIVGRIVRGALVKKYAEFTHLDIFELDKLAWMKAHDWFELVPSKTKGLSKLVFTKKRLEQGIYTGDAPETAPEKPVEE